MSLAQRVIFALTITLTLMPIGIVAEPTAVLWDGGDAIDAEGQFNKYHNTQHTAAAGDFHSVVSQFQMRVLESGEGLSYSLGSMNLVQRSDCDQLIAIFGNCFGFNPAAPYIVPAFPAEAGEYIDPNYGITLGNTNTENHYASWRIRPDAAHVIIGRTPPQGAYFGYQSYLFTRMAKPNLSFKRQVLRWYDKSTADLLFSVSPNPNRLAFFASLGDSINNQVIAEQISQSPVNFANEHNGFDQLVAFITTPDPELASNVKAKLLQSGLGGHQIFIEQIPETMQLGLGAQADDFVTLLRYALPSPVATALAAEYRENLPFAVMRVSPVQPKEVVDGFSAKAYAVRGGVSEEHLTPALRNLANEVRQFFGERSKLNFLGSAFVPASSIGLNGQDCIKNGMNCLGDTRDTDTYRVAQKTFLDNDAQVLAVVGVDHTNTGNASYVSLSINAADQLRGVAAVSQTNERLGFLTGQLRDSASRFLQQQGRQLKRNYRHLTGDLYVHFFSRDCTGLAFCTVISQDPVTGIPKGDALTIMQRAYIVPGQKRGANPENLVSPLLLQLSR